MKALLEQALELPAEARRGFLRAATTHPPELRAEALALLEHAEATGGTLDTPAAALVAGPASDDDHLGERLGPWRITAPLGSGGMGRVFVAERADGAFEAKAAVKVLRRGLDSDEVLRRFHLEQQTLARLDHPHIARLLDAGRTASGLPYFVMELVLGVPIDQFCAGLPLQRRLAVFLDLAEAVAHAHRNLLLHRDLKPSNVLVTAEGEIKLLDFGIAKALEPAADVAQTQGGQGPFTPGFASPEQIRGEPVGTATDVYSLGVLLYVLLTGQRPYGRTSTTVAQALYAAVNEAPAFPRGLPADLARVVLKALEKEVAARYASVDAFAADVRNYLAGKPVSARPASPSYLARKFVARHRTAVAAGTLGLAALLGALVARNHQARIAQARFESIKDILRTVVQRYGDAITNLPGGLPIREELLSDAVAQLGRLSASAGDDVQLTGDLAAAYSRLADMQGDLHGVTVSKQEEALTNANKALALFARLPPRPALPAEMQVWRARAHATVGKVVRERGDPAAALLHFEQAATLLRAALEQLPGDRGLRIALAAALFQIGQTNDHLGLPNLNRAEPALAAFAEAKTLTQRLQDEAPKGDGQYLQRLSQLEDGEGCVFQKRERLAEAVAHLLRAVELSQQALAATAQPDSARLFAHAIALNNLGYLQLRLADDVAAVKSSGQAFELVDRLGRENPGVAVWAPRKRIFEQGYGIALAANGRCGDAVSHLGGVAAGIRAVLAQKETAADSRRLALNLVSQSRCLPSLGRGVEAVAAAREAETRLSALLAKEPKNRDLLLNHGESLRALAALVPTERRALLEQARGRYDAASALLPLAADNERDYRDLVASLTQ